MVQMKSEGCLLENSLLFGKAGLFFLFGYSVDWRRPTHIRKGTLLGLRPPVLMFISFKNILRKTLRIVFNQLSGHSMTQPN